MDDKQQNFYKRLLITIRVKCLKQGIKKSEFCLKQGRKISNICLKQGQGTRGRAAPPYPGIYRVPPRGSGSEDYMLFAGWEVRIVKNCDRGLENAFSRPRSQFFTIRTDLSR